MAMEIKICEDGHPTLRTTLNHSTSLTSIGAGEAAPPQAGA